MILFFLILAFAVTLGALLGGTTGALIGAVVVLGLAVILGVALSLVETP